MGVKYEYNDTYIEIPVDIMGASAIGISGVKIGSSKDYDRIKGLLPCQARIDDKVSSIADVVVLNQGTNKIQATSGSNNIALSKSGSDLIYKVTT